jgi:hypothetical protein
MRSLGILATTLILGACSDSSGTSPPLTTQEQDDLTFMREEEKLARDVYAALDSYGQEFVNIQTSEQKHFDAIGTLLVTYGVDDPAAGQADGAFTNPTLQSLYDSLIAQGSPSRLDAVGVGCAIEELDLRDLTNAKAATSHGDIVTVYDNLMMGSRNHLRAYYGAVVAAGGAYTPVYLDQASFDAIVTSPHEHGGM